MERAAAAGDGGEEVSDNTLLPTCTTAMVADRTKAVARGDLDVYGIAAGCCTHAVPCRGLVTHMPTPENYMFYDKIVVACVKARPDAKFFYLDLACRYVKRFGQRMQELLDVGILATCEMMIRVPWMHGFDHDVSCQYKHSGLYTVRKGGCIDVPSLHGLLLLLLLLLIKKMFCCGCRRGQVAVLVSKLSICGQ